MAYHTQWLGFLCCWNIAPQGQQTKHRHVQYSVHWPGSNSVLSYLCNQTWSAPCQVHLLDKQ